MSSAKTLCCSTYFLTGKIGGIADCVRKIVFRGEWDGYQDFVKTELADLSFLVRRFCQVVELDYGEVVRLGAERDAEKKASYERRHPESRWV